MELSDAPAREQAAAPKRVTRRRGETRARLLGAAFEVFAQHGFGRATVERICEQAGFTRGAFYSNFTSLDELFLAMWEQNTEQLTLALRTALNAEARRPNSWDELEAYARRLIASVPVDDNWYRVSAEFTAHALRNPALKQVIAAREESVLAALLPIVAEALAGAGRRALDLPALGRALVAVHDGTSVQCLMEPDDDAVRRGRTDLFIRVLLSYSEEV
ncbi:TetR/AcrR family transcriptional regulator [Mycobacterium sp. M1]|uniref:TetR/AcrR family transcriptional regulator n=1 Tax=Mycolicibacter acidiphilus TaxID=2835306 RepID=A0ABS5RFQ2_9MYCO|nr:TetR/AcrR family transcriptional regulator [Mycolicibacter acidiphilus]MBS9533102.1 TetR/AcrR family transcriptional regulator [Mycolicibacter acidiphilus]